MAWTQCNFNSKACGGEYSKHAHRDEDKFYNQGFHDNCVCDTGYHLQCDSDKDRKNCECTKIKIQEKSDPAGFAQGYEHVGIGVCDPDNGKRFTGEKHHMGMPICTNECSSHEECNCGVVSECMEDWKTGSGNRVNAGEKCLGCGDCKPCCDESVLKIKDQSRTIQPYGG